jgi:hypothetical protein
MAKPLLDTLMGVLSNCVGVGELLKVSEKTMLPPVAPLTEAISSTVWP